MKFTSLNALSIRSTSFGSRVKRNTKMSNRNLFANSLFSALFLQQFQFAHFISVENIWMKNNEDAGAVESLHCFRKYFDFHSIDMGKMRFSVIHDPILYRAPIEKLFLKKSNEQFQNPITLTTLALVDNKRRNYLIFLLPIDLGKLKNISLPNVHDESFLYIFYEQGDVIISLSDIYSKFTPFFEQNIILMTTSVNASGHLSQWSAFRIVLRKCIGQYKTIKVSECDGANDFNVFPLMRGESCPLQVAGRNDPPFADYDPIRGFHSGIEYRFVRVISERTQIPINFTYIDFAMTSSIINESSQPNATAPRKKNMHLEQVN